MKSSLLKLLFAVVLTMPFSVAQAQIFPALAIFNGETGKMQIPNLIFDGKLYYLELSVADASALTLQIEEGTVFDVTPDGSTVGKTTDDIVGTWDVDGEATSITFNADGTWVLSQQAGDDTESCPDGGDETGTFRYTPSTGVFIPIFLTDSNGECGLSGVEGVMRIFTDGNTMTLAFVSEEGATLIRSE